MSFGTKVTKAWNGQAVKIHGEAVVRKSAYETGLVVEGQAKLLSPIKTGRLAGSITTQAVDIGTDVKYPARLADKITRPSDRKEVFVGTNVEYGPYIEYGTMRSDAQPFLRPALDMATGKTLTILERNGRMEFKDYLR